MRNGRMEWETGNGEWGMENKVLRNGRDTYINHVKPVSRIRFVSALWILALSEIV